VNRKFTIALGAAILGVALIPATARASTPECTGGTYAGYCGTQADSGSPVLVMDVKGLRFNVGNPVIGWTNSSTDPATPWVPARNHDHARQRPSWLSCGPVAWFDN
jgi:hypothetical protein